MTFSEVLSKPISKVSRRDSDTEAARIKMEELEDWLGQRKIELERSVVTCVTCGKTAKYTRQAGWMQGVHHIFTCSDGHESPYQLNSGKLEVYQWLIDQRKKGKVS